MPDKENKRREWSAADADAAAAKLWEVYVTEAEKYDEGLVDSWKKDMEGLLIFAALFSAILTAFIIESYKSLSPDDTVQVLSQISQQLAAVAGGKPFDISLTPTFAPPVSSIVCNALWFISLGLSLACALIATLVQQWARDFLHKTQLRSAPGLRAPIFTYFYYGLKRFGMHRVVEVIPLLLHGSLALFFAGLLAFLIPVNTALAAITALILLIVGGLYVVFTLLPLQWLDCPYHTPLSATSWMGWTALQRTWLARRHRVQNKDAEFASTHPPHRDSIPLAGILTGPTPTAPALTEPAGSVPPHPRHDTMMKAMLHAAAENSEGRKVREYKALVWTMGSLADNSELEPFIQGIVNVLEEPHERRPAYEEHIRCLSRESDNHLLDRIANLLDSCTTALLSQEAVQRRRITCYKALWLIASLLTKPGEAVDFEYIYSRPSFHSEEHYCISARAIMAYSTLIAVEPQILQWSDSTWRQMSSKFYSRVVSHSWSYLTPARSVDALASISSNIYLDFVATAALSSSSPYRWAETRATLTKSHEGIHGFDLLNMLNRAVSTQRDTSKPDDMAWFDESVLELLSLWTLMLSQIPTSVIRFVRCRPSESPLPNDIDLHLWSCLPRTLSLQMLSLPQAPIEDLLTAMWCAASNWRRHDGERRERVAASLATPSSPLNPGARGVEFRRRTEVGSEPSRPSILQAALKVLSSTNFPPAEAQISQSIVVMLKIEILDAVPGSFSTVREALRSLDHPLFPTETAVHIPDEIHSMGEDEKSKGNSIWFRSETNSIWRGFLWDKKLEAIFCVIIQYLQHCASSTLPYNAAKTLKKIGMSPPRRIHPAHQARLAERIGIIFETEQASELVDAVIDLKWWALYAGGHKTEEEMKLKRKRGFLPWLQDPDARQMITDTFVKYKGKSKARAEKIVEGLKCWHPEGTAPNAVAQSGDTPAGERRAEPIASSSRDRSSEEGGE